jgi:hypothetical protein
VLSSSLSAVELGVLSGQNQSIPIIAPLNLAEGTAVASAATIDPWATDGNTIHLTGTTTVSSLGTAPNVGATRTIINDSEITFTHSTNLNLPGAADITFPAGSSFEIYADTTTQIDVRNITYSDGRNNNNKSYSGRVLASSGSGAVSGPSGFTYSWSTNNCTITHNLGTTNYTIVGFVTETITAPQIRIATGRGTNDFLVTTTNGGVGTALTFDFIIIAD